MYTDTITKETVLATLDIQSLNCNNLKHLQCRYRLCSTEGYLEKGLKA